MKTIRLNRWHRCHSCRCFYRGHLRVTELPRDCDGVIMPGTCLECFPPVPMALQDPRKPMLIAALVTILTLLHGGLLLLLNF